jgi:hypothetical protein
VILDVGKERNDKSKLTDSKKSTGSTIVAQKDAKADDITEK